MTVLVKPRIKPKYTVKFQRRRCDVCGEEFGDLGDYSARDEVAFCRSCDLWRPFRAWGFGRRGTGNRELNVSCSGLEKALLLMNKGIRDGNN